jgi:twitching motility protein PilT
MPSGKDLLAQFKAASWRSPEEIEAFVESVEAPAAADLLKLLEIVTGKSPDANVARGRLQVFTRLVDKNPDKTLFLPFVKVLKGAEPTLRATLAALIPKVNSAVEHAALAEHLRSDDAGLRATVARIFALIGGSKIIFEMLTRAVGEGSYKGRTEALDVLVGFAKHQAIPALLAAIQAGTIAEKVHALRHLGDRTAMAKDPAAALKVIAPLLDAQQQEEPVVIQGILSFSNLCAEEDWFEYVAIFLDADSVGMTKAAVDGLRRFSSARVIAALERKLRAGPRPIRLAVLNALEVIGTDAVLPPLVDALGHKQIPVRNRGAEVLKQLSMANKLDLSRTVIWLLRSRDVNVRRMATEVIRAVPDPDQSLWPKLMGVLRDEDWWVRERVMDALVDLGGTRLTPHMVPMLSDASDVVRRFAVNVLGRIKDPKALRSLVQIATQDPDWWVKETAIEAVALINDPRAVPYLVQIMDADPDLQPVCIQALLDMGAKDAAPQVAALCNSESADVRYLAVMFLDKFDASAHAPTVAKLNDDPHLRVRKAARDLIARWRITAQGTVALAVPLLDRLLAQLTAQEGDDLIVSSGKPVFMKKVGRITALTQGPLEEEQVKALLMPHLSTEQVIALQALQDVDYSHEVKSEGLRFRANVFQQFGGLSGVFRRIRGTLPQFEKLGLPPLVRTFGDLKNGLVLVGGPTGSGKSTTLAALIDYINRTSSRHIISLEDPIEVIHHRKNSLVNQREVGTHTRSFAAALRSTLREDPNVILVGEMRDLPTIEFTVIAAETGHLVFGTVHTVSAATTVDRIVSAFPPGQQEQVRSTLADSLRAVVCQYLMKEKTGGGRVLAVELLINNDAVSNLIRKGKAFQLPSVISTSREQGMQLMDNDLMRLLKEGRITAEDAYVKAIGKKDFEPFVEEEEKKAQAARPRMLRMATAVQASGLGPQASGPKPVPSKAPAPSMPQRPAPTPGSGPEHSAPSPAIRATPGSGPQPDLRAPRPDIPRPARKP